MNWLFLPRESVAWAMLFYLSTSGDISVNKKYQESTGVWSHKKGPTFIYTMSFFVCYTGQSVNKRVKREISTTEGNIELSQRYLPKPLHRLLFSLLSFTTREGMPFYGIHPPPICMSNQMLWKPVVEDWLIHRVVLLPPDSKGMIQL